MKIKYTYIRGNVAMYQRKIPTDLQDRFDGATHIKKNLRTLDPTSVAKQTQVLNQHYESLWESMRRDPSITPTGVRAEALKLLEQYSLKPLPAANNPTSIEHFIDLVVEPKRDAAARGDEHLYRTLSPDEYLSATETEALRILRNVPQFMLSEALELYLRTHQKANNPTFISYTRRTWQKLMDIVGDKPVIDVTREDANGFVEKLLSTGSKTTTVKRNISAIKAIFNVALIEKSLNKTNPFNKLRIPGLGEDAEEREPFELSELKTLAEKCRSMDDDMRWLLALLIDQGGRLGEFVGLELTDFHLDGPTPFLRIEKKPWRSLKTIGSSRDVPLVGVSLWAARRITATAPKQQRFAFPRYTDGKTCRATSASKALNDWIAAQGIQKTTHSFRHSMRDRLRQVNAPKDIQDAIGGWGKQTIADNYGRGYGLQIMHEWLSKVVFLE